MRSGDYSVALSNPGFHDELTALVIDDEAAQTHSFDMRKLPGIVTINSTPAGGRVNPTESGSRNRAQDDSGIQSRTLQDVRISPGP